MNGGELKKRVSLRCWSNESAPNPHREIASPPNSVRQRNKPRFSRPTPVRFGKLLHICNINNITSLYFERRKYMQILVVFIVSKSRSLLDSPFCSSPLAITHSDHPSPHFPNQASRPWLLQSFDRRSEEQMLRQGLLSPRYQRWPFAWPYLPW